MPIKKYKPITPGRRFMSTLVNDEITNVQSEKKLTKILNKKSGRNNTGKITIRHHGGGKKRKYRLIDFKRNKFDVPGVIARIEYDPNRNVNIALVNYIDGEKRYILATEHMKKDMKIISSKKNKVKISEGNACLISEIPEGVSIHNIELYPGRGGQLARSAGSFGKILGKDETQKFTLVQLSSGEVRKIFNNCMVTIGELGNKDYNLINFGKAGRLRNKGIRPTVRGSAMNPVDHPHGGGEGRTGIGRKSPLTPWGKPTLGAKTRKKNKSSNKYIVRKRKNRK